jgi:hypothetical protein
VFFGLKNAIFTEKSRKNGIFIVKKCGFWHKTRQIAPASLVKYPIFEKKYT